MEHLQLIVDVPYSAACSSCRLYSAGARHTATLYGREPNQYWGDLCKTEATELVVTLGVQLVLCLLA